MKNYYRIHKERIERVKSLWLTYKRQGKYKEELERLLEDYITSF